MKYIKLGDVSSWVAVDPNSALDLHAEKPRKAKFQFNSSANIEVFVKSGDEKERFLISGSGLQQVEFTISTDSELFVYADDNCAIEVKSFATDQRVPKFDGASFTSIAPPERRSTEYDRIAYALRKQQEQFNRQMQEFTAVVEPVAPPTPLKAEKPVKEAKKEAPDDVTSGSD